jgi:hypothetical protein
VRSGRRHTGDLIARNPVRIKSAGTKTGKGLRVGVAPLYVTYFGTTDELMVQN